MTDAEPTTQNAPVDGAHCAEQLRRRQLAETIEIEPTITAMRHQLAEEAARYEIHQLGVRYFAVFDTRTGLVVSTRTMREAAEKRAAELLDG